MADSHGPVRRGSTTRTALIALATFVVGAFGGHLLRAFEHAPQPATRDDAHGDLAAELASIRTELDRLRRTVEGASPNLAGPRVESRREGVAASADLEAILARFERALVELDRPAPTPSARPPTAGQGRASITQIEGEIASRAPEELDALALELSRAHYLWTVDDVVDRYGNPNYVPGGLQLVYGLAGDRSDRPQRSIQFRIEDGRVTEVLLEP